MIPRERLVLGTAKLGMPWYGYHSTSRPTAVEAIAILRHAWRAGIRLYDTALGYGDAMALLATAGVSAKYIYCKARPPLYSFPLTGNEYHWFIHNPQVAEFSDVPCGCGVSVYTVAEVAEARRRKLAPIQAPASCLNPAVEVEFGRAPFLQGVLLRDPFDAPLGLEAAVESFQKLADKSGAAYVALALHAAYGERIVFGVSSVAQLQWVLWACEQDVPAELIAEARALAATVDATAALPSLWSKA